jgi:hypothetical protein
MAATKRSSSSSQKPQKTLPHSLYKETWRLFKGGGKYLEYEFDRLDKLEPVPLEEIKPDTPYYMQQVWKPYEFYPTVFDPKVSWDTIKELQPRIWRLIQSPKETITNSKSETGSGNSGGLML